MGTHSQLFVVFCFFPRLFLGGFALCVHSSTVTAYISQFDAVFNFIGHGAQNQIKDITAIAAVLDKLIHANNTLYSNKWLACYGGDPYNREKPDIAAVMKYLADQGVPVMCVQCADYGRRMFDEKGQLDDCCYGFLSAAAVYEADVGEPAMLPHPTNIGETKKNILFGGYKPGTTELVGTTKYVFESRVFGDKLKGQVACGGGCIALQEVEAALSRGIACLYVPVEPKHVAGGAPYGLLHSWFEEHGLPVSVSDPRWGWVRGTPPVVTTSLKHLFNK